MSITPTFLTPSLPFWNLSYQYKDLHTFFYSLTLPYFFAWAQTLHLDFHQFHSNHAKFCFAFQSFTIFHSDFLRLAFAFYHESLRKPIRGRAVFGLHQLCLSRVLIPIVFCRFNLLLIKLPTMCLNHKTKPASNSSQPNYGHYFFLEFSVILVQFSPQALPWVRLPIQSPSQTCTYLNLFLTPI